MITCEHKRTLWHQPGIDGTVPFCAVSGGLCADAEAGRWFERCSHTSRGCDATTGPWGAWRAVVPSIDRCGSGVIVSVGGEHCRIVDLPELSAAVGWSP